MSIDHAAIAARHLRSRGYLDAAPYTLRVRNLVAHGAIVHRLAKASGIGSSTLHAIHRGEAKFVNTHNADIIENLTVSEALEMCADPTPYVDDVALDRLLAGEPVTVVSYDKPAYARALYTHSWHRTRISRALAMSGASVNKALAGMDRP